MLNHIAVMLRGHIRTWRWIYPFVFDFYEKIALNVDYYMITWQGSQHYTNLYGSFENKNLIALRLLEPVSDFSDSYVNAAYHNYMLLPYKHEREKTIKYDMVVDTRPDVIPVLQKNAHVTLPEPNTYYTTQFELHHNFLHNEYDVAISDWFMISNSKVHDIMSERFIYSNEQGNQVTIRHYAEQQGFSVNSLNYVKAFMARPNIHQAIDNNGKLDTTLLSKLCSEWAMLSKEEKLDIMNTLHIPTMDFSTGSRTCSI
jgi:hypothetical protein